VTIVDNGVRPPRRRAAVVRMPRGITETQSYTWVLREALIGALLPLFDGFTLLRTNQKPIQKQDLPVLGAYILQEKMSPDGDLKAGNIRFIHDFQIGFSIVIANNDPDVAEQKLDAASWTLMNGLWCNAGLTNMINSSTPDNVRFEGVLAGHRWPIGSRLWLLRRSKIVGPQAFGGATVTLVEQYIREAIQPFIDLGVATSMNVKAWQATPSQINAHLMLFRGPSIAVDLTYQVLWDEIATIALQNMQPTLALAPPQQNRLLGRR
jgi:phage gp46-like protein